MGKRHLQIILIFAAVTVNMTQRVCLFLAIVAMMDPKTVDFPSYDWDSKVKSYVVAALFWGNILTQIPGGTLSYKYGAKYVLLIPSVISSILCALIPIATEVGGWELLLAVRFLQGLCQGMVYPITTTFLSHWSPRAERGLLVSFTFSGTPFGATMMYAVGGYLASSPFGWPSVFYFSAFITLVWSLFWYLFCFNTPLEHPKISEKELELIENGRLRSTVASGPTPWCKIATSVPFLTVLLTHCANNWGFSTLLTQIPTYMDGVHNVKMRENGLMSAMPYIAMFMLTFVFGVSNHYITRNCSFPLIYARKVYNTIGFFIPMFAILVLAFKGASSESLSIMMLVIAVGFTSAAYVGYQLNHIDLSPKFAGPMMGVTNCAANIVGVVLPVLITGYIVTNEHDASQWQIVFCITAAVYFFGNMLFLIFAVGSVQHWCEEEYQASLAVKA